MWSAAVFEPARPGRSSSAAGSPAPPTPWSTNPSSGWNPNDLPGAGGVLLVGMRVDQGGVQVDHHLSLLGRCAGPQPDPLRDLARIVRCQRPAPRSKAPRQLSRQPAASRGLHQQRRARVRRQRLTAGDHGQPGTQASILHRGVPLNSVDHGVSNHDQTALSRHFRASTGSVSPSRSSSVKAPRLDQVPTPWCTVLPLDRNKPLVRGAIAPVRGETTSIPGRCVGEPQSAVKKGRTWGCFHRPGTCHHAV
jgi:hypothetical protein